MSSSSAVHPPRQPREASPWLSRPWLDWTVGCGGWSAPLLVLAYTLSDTRTAQSATLFYALALVCNYPHYMATVYRAWQFATHGRQQSVIVVATATVAALGIAGLAWPPLAPWLFTLYVMWSPWHYAGQNFGLSVLFLRRAGITLAATERRWLHSAFVASYVVLLAAFNQGPSREHMVRSLGLADAVAWPVEAAGALVFLGGVMVVVARVTQRAGWRPLVPSLTLWSTQALWFVVPVVVARIPHTANASVTYSTGVLALMHSAQYLWIAQHSARTESQQRGDHEWTARRYAATLVTGGIALFIPLPWALSLAGHLDFSTSALVIAAVVNLHHFVLDGLIWKLRDPRVAAALVAGARPEGRAPTVRDGRQSRLRRWLVPATAVALAGLALLDQWRHVLTMPAASADALRAARALNPNDSTVQTRLAAMALRDGRGDEAEHELRAAVAANPYDPAPLRLLIRHLIGAERLQEAHERSLTLLRVAPPDAETLANTGVLAHRLGRRDEAAQRWAEALTLDDERADLHLYLAEVLDGAGRTAEALTHYQRHLELIAAGSATPEARAVALVMVKFADALMRSGQQALAIQQYNVATEIGRAHHLADIEALAAAHRGAVR